MIQDLDQTATYKYLGMEEGEGIQHHKMKVKIRKEYKIRIKVVLKSELNAREKIVAINTLAVPIILHSYGIIDWKLDEIQDLDRMTRKQLCMMYIYICQEGRCRQDLPPMPRRWKITHEYGKGIQSHNDRTTDIHDKQGWCPDTSCPLTPKCQGSSLCTQGSWEIPDRGWNNGWHDQCQHGKTATWKAKQLKPKCKEDF